MDLRDLAKKLMCLIVNYFFIVLPPGCTSYDGPNPRICYENIGVNAGCLILGVSATVGRLQTIFDMVNIE